MTNNVTKKRGPYYARVRCVIVLRDRCVNTNTPVHFSCQVRDFCLSKLCPTVGNQL